MEPTLNSWTSLFLIAAAQGVFFSVLIFIRSSKIKNRSHFWLASLILTYSILLSYYVAYWSGFINNLPVFTRVIFGFTMLLGPMGYLYLKKLLNTPDERYWYLHFLPFMFFASLMASGTYSESWGTPVNILQCLHLGIYSLLMVRLTHSQPASSLVEWSKKVSIAFGVFTISFLSYYVLVWTGILKIEYDYMISLAMSLMIYYIGYQGFMQPSIFEKQKVKYQKSNLTELATSDLLSRLETLMESEKPYLDNGLKLPSLAAQLGVSTHTLSQVINERKSKSFSDFINEYRIREAKEILEQNPDYKIIGVAFDSGFNNKVTFLNTFKKFVGVSPSMYREKFSTVNR